MMENAINLVQDLQNYPEKFYFRFLPVNPINKLLNIFHIFTSPGKKQQCFRSICLPKLICSRVSRICRVSIMSDSHANG